MSDILRMLKMFEVNHELCPAAQRDIEEIIAAVRSASATPSEAKAADGVVLLPAEATDEMQDNMRQALIDQGWDSDSAGEVDFADLWHAGVYEYQERMADMLAAKAKGGGA